METNLGSEYVLGIAEIDSQHKKFVELVNSLKHAIEDIEVEERIQNILTELSEYRTYHFATEEQYFDMFHYKDSKSHKEAHKEFVDMTLKLENEYKEDIVGLAFRLSDIVVPWLKSHIISFDKKYIDCFKSNGIY